MKSALITGAASGIGKACAVRMAREGYGVVVADVNLAFKAAALLWITAREPWETSEAFLFGPVADKGLDPNMDSWPLDVDALKNTLASGKFDNLTWEGEFDENDETIAAVQNVRGFHTLEFLLFYNGTPRTLSK